MKTNYSTMPIEDVCNGQFQFNPKEESDRIIKDFYFTYQATEEHSLKELKGRLCLLLILCETVGVKMNSRQVINRMNSHLDHVIKCN